MSVNSTITVTGRQPYDVSVGQNLTADIAAFAGSLDSCTKALILYQPGLGERCNVLAEAVKKAGVEPVVVPIPDAEKAKTISECARLWDLCGEYGFGRKDSVIGFGGGACTDLAGFVAAGWMRGIRVIQVPTTLLAMVDAAVGGKTGVNTSAGKNLVGAFHEPSAVFIDTEVLKTLPDSDVVAGSAEIVKTGFIADEKILDLYENDPVGCLKGGTHVEELITRSVAVKANVVSQDLEEAGLREILNYGHTFGHAVELNENFTWRHGQAVAVGMMFIAHLSRLAGLTDHLLIDRHEHILKSIGLPVTYKPGCFDALYAGMAHDKKNRAGTLRFVALEEQGRPTRLVGPSKELLKEAYDAISCSAG